MSVRKDLNALLDWYDANAKEVLRVPVVCRPATLRKFCKKKRGDPRLMYRGREIVPTKKAKKDEALPYSLDSLARDEMQQYGTPGENHLGSPFDPTDT